MSQKTKTVKYQKKDLKTHIYQIPDTYVGSVKSEEVVLDILKDNKIVPKKINYIPALYKIFDEIIVNARDETERTSECDTIKVHIDKDEENKKYFISVYNNGKGIPVTKHEEEKIMTPELIFCVLLTSSNYDENEQKTTGGKNGYGAKLVNIFSKKFVIETLDPENGKKYVQVCTDNMNTIEKPTITSSKNKQGYVKITFIPDYERFGIEDLSDDMIALFKKRTYDLACCSNVNGKKIKVYFNDELIKENTFQKYINLYYDDSVKKIIDDTDERWKIGAVYNHNSEFKQVSFVNGIATTEGGKHVEYILNQIIKKITDILSKKHKDLTIKPQMIKDGLNLFINSIIVNPSFSSQTKTTLTTVSKDFGSKYVVPDVFISKLMKSGIVDNIVQTAKSKESGLIEKQNGKKKKTIIVDKLEDATDAGGANSEDTYLILTEGDSAKALAMAGYKIIGRKKYGVFPLKGKILNVRGASVKQLLNNSEVNNLVKILGLKFKQEYTDTKTLRYSGIIILSDQDYDGSHIKGLLINFIHYFWPSLLKNVKNFIVSMPTPIVKALKGKKTEIFYTMKEFEDWKEKADSSWTIKYYKGLGTHTSKEAQDCFKDFDKKLVKYVWTNEEYEEYEKPKKNNSKKKINQDSENIENDELNSEEEDEDEENEENTVEKKKNKIVEMNGYMPVHPNKCEDSILLGFSNDCIPQRKGWLLNYDRNEIIDNSKTKVPFSDFIHKELKHFSNYDVERSIPSAIDGLKPSLRKILYGAFKKKLKKEIKVAQFAGYIGEHCGYHHGEMSLYKAIVGMAQTYVGSNNINLLYPGGQFGTRLEGGKDAASARYIFTKLTDMAFLLFPEKDFNVLEYLKDDDGDKIEPKWYCPILPVILINGGKGIGTGFSTSVPSYNPLDIVNNIKRLMDGKKQKEMIPWYNNFKGTIEKIEDYKYTSKGCYTIKENKLHITELPIGIWTSNYKSMLNKMLLAEEKTVDKKKEKKKKTEVYLSKFTDKNDDENVDFTLTFKEGMLEKLVKNNTLEKKFKLSKLFSSKNMYLFDENGIIKKYKTPQEIIEEHYNIRIKMYGIRKKYILNKLTLVLELLKWTREFIKCVINGTIIINKKKKQEIIDKVIELKFPMLNEKIDNYVQENNNEMPEDEDNNDSKKSYNYITKLPLFSLTKDKIDELENKYNDTKKEFDELKKKSEIDLWNEELDKFTDFYKDFSEKLKK